MAAAISYIQRTGVTLYSGDAEAHLDIARRIVDSLTPGWSQVGTTWLPLPHLLMMPLVRNDWLWRTGLAAPSPPASAMTLAAAFLFAAVRRIFADTSCRGRGCRGVPAEPEHALHGIDSDERSRVLCVAVRAALLHACGFARHADGARCRGRGSRHSAER